MGMKLDNIMNGKSYFGGPLDPEISSLLEDAAIHFSDTGKALSSLLEAREKAPYALAVFFSLYKFYFYKTQLDLAEKTVRESLFEAAYQGDFRWSQPSLKPRGTLVFSILLLRITFICFHRRHSPLSC